MKGRGFNSHRPLTNISNKIHHLSFKKIANFLGHTEWTMKLIRRLNLNLNRLVTVGEMESIGHQLLVINVTRKGG